MLANKIDRLPPVIEDLVLRMANSNIPLFERDNCYSTLSMICSDIEEYLENYEKELGYMPKKRK